MKKFIKLILGLAVIFLAVFLVIRFDLLHKKPEITNSMISSRLEAASDLTTAELEYNGLIKYEDGKIKFITKKEFIMTYYAQVKAGIDVSEIEVNVTDKKVILKVPEIKIQSINVDENSIHFYDEHSSLFNWSKKEDAVEAIKVAKADLLESADISSLKEKAKAQSELILTNLIEPIIGEDKKLVIVFE